MARILLPKGNPVDSFASMSRAPSFEAESEISSRSHKPAPDCRNSEWDYADCAGHNRVAIGLRGAMGDGSEIRTVRLRNLRACDVSRLAIRIIGEWD